MTEDTPFSSSESGPKAPSDSVTKKPSFRQTTIRMLTGRTSAEAPIIAILAATVFRMLLEVAIYTPWHVGHYPFALAQQLTFYTYMFVCFAFILSVTMRLPFSRVTNVASVGLVFSVLPPVLHALVFHTDDRPTVYFQEFTWTLFTESQATAESVVLWLLIGSTALFVGLMKRSFLRGVIAGILSYVVIQALSIGVLEVLKLRDETGEIFFNVQWSARSVRNFLVALGQAGVPFLLYAFLRFHRLRRAVARLTHALPHVALMLCGAAWTGNFGDHLWFFGALLFAGFFVLLVQNDYFDRKEDALAGRATGPARNDMIWITFLYLNLLLATFGVFPWLVMILCGIQILGLLYHHPAVRLKTRFCLSYLVEGGWASLAFCVGVAGLEHTATEVGFAGMVHWIFWGGALLSMSKDWKDVDADRAAGIWTVYVTASRRWSVARVHLWVSISISLGLFGFGVFAAVSGGGFRALLPMGAAGIFLWFSQRMHERDRFVEVAMLLYTVALLGVAWCFSQNGHG